MERDTDVRDLLRPHVPRTELYESYLPDEVSVAKNELISMRFFCPVLERHDTRLQMYFRGTDEPDKLFSGRTA